MNEELLNMFKFNDNLKIEDFLKIAYDHKKLEIEMYWKRATYFWGFVVLSYSALFLINNSKNATTNQTTWFLTLQLVISAMGLVFSWGWYLVNRGSKYSTRKWQGIIDSLEEKIGTPFNRLSIVDNSRLYHLLSSYRISITKINLVISIFNTLVWATFFFTNVWEIIIHISGFTIDVVRNFAIILVTLLVLTMLAYSTRDKKDGSINIRLRY